MLHAKFVIAEHEEAGFLGAKMANRRWADPVGGMGAAHDMLEHFPRDDGSVEHELMALGASLLVRSYYDYSNGNAAENIASEFPMQCGYMARNGRMYIRTPKRTAMCDVDEEIREVVERAQKLCRDEGIEPGDMRWVHKQGDDIVGWMRTGYRRAQRRFRGISRVTLGSAFSDAERLVDQFIRHADLGMEFRLSIDPRRGCAKLRELSEAYY